MSGIDPGSVQTQQKAGSGGEEVASKDRDSGPEFSRKHSFMACRQGAGVFFPGAELLRIFLE